MIRPAARPDQGSEATRHLCTGVYVDRKFRDMVLRKVHNAPGHRVSPSYGFDLVAVVRHAWRAWVLEIAQHAGVLSVLVIGYVLDAPAAVAAVSAMGLWPLGRKALRAVPEWLRLKSKISTERWMRRRMSHAESSRLREQTRLLAISAGACFVLVAIPMMVAGSQKVPLQEMARTAGQFLLVMIGVAAAAGAARQRRLNKLKTARSLRPATLTRREAVIDNQQSHTYVVYRRPEPRDETEDLPLLSDPRDEPTFFVGSGQLLHRWLPPLVIQLLRPGDGSLAQREYTAAPFKAHELVDHLRDAVERVRDADDPIRLPGLQVRDRVYVAEKDIASDRECLRTNSGPGHLYNIIDDPHGIAAHFLEISVTTSGELVTTVFLRVTIKGRSLSLDFAACAITGTPSGYHMLDAFAESGKGAVLRSALCGVRDFPAEIGRSWRLAEAPLLFARAAWARKDRTLVPRRRVTIGTRLSVRDEKSTPWDEAQFDEPVILGQMKIIELCLIKATEEFLGRHNVDISSFKKRAENIISASVLNIGGRINIKDSTIGSGGQINNNRGTNGADGGTSPEGARP